MQCMTSEHTIILKSKWPTAKQRNTGRQTKSLQQECKISDYHCWRSKSKSSQMWMLCDLVTWPFKMLGNTHPMTQCHIPEDSLLQQECHSTQDREIILTTSVIVQIVVVYNKSSMSAADQQIFQDTTTLGPNFKLCNLKCFWTQSHFTERYLFHCSTNFLFDLVMEKWFVTKKCHTTAFISLPFL